MSLDLETIAHLVMFVIAFIGMYLSFLSEPE